MVGIQTRVATQQQQSGLAWNKDMPGASSMTDERILASIQVRALNWTSVVPRRNGPPVRDLTRPAVGHRKPDETRCDKQADFQSFKPRRTCERCFAKPVWDSEYKRNAICGS
jgi:hypothetical protein